MGEDKRTWRSWEKFVKSGDFGDVDSRVKKGMFETTENLERLNGISLVESYKRLLLLGGLEKEPGEYLVEFTLSPSEWKTFGGRLFVFGRTYQASAANPEIYVGHCGLALRTFEGWDELAKLEIIPALKGIADPSGLKHDEGYFKAETNPRKALFGK